MALLRRRELLGAAAGALALPDLSAANVLGPTSSDRQVLARLVEIEQQVELGYERVLSAGVLSKVAQPVAAEFPAHEREHVRVLSSELERRGGTPPAPPARQPASPSNSPDAVRYLISLETLAEAAYYGSMPRLSDPALMRLAAELMCCEAQHWSALSELLHSGDVYSAVPTATITGG